MNRRSFFALLAGAAAFVAAPFKAKAGLSRSPPHWDNYLKFAHTPHHERMTLDFTTNARRALKQIKEYHEQEPIQILPAETLDNPKYLLYGGGPKAKGRQTNFADGRPYVSLRDDLRAALRAARTTS